MLINIDPNAPHDEDCGFWEGGACRCKPEMAAALERDHCHECDFLHGSGYNRCSCGGQCICEREEGCPCVGRLPAPVVALASEPSEPTRDEERTDNGRQRRA